MEHGKGSEEREAKKTTGKMELEIDNIPLPASNCEPRLASMPLEIFIQIIGYLIEQPITFLSETSEYEFIIGGSGGTTCQGQYRRLDMMSLAEAGREICPMLRSPHDQLVLRGLAKTCRRASQACEAFIYRMPIVCDYERKQFSAFLNTITQNKPHLQASMRSLSVVYRPRGHPELPDFATLKAVYGAICSLNLSGLRNLEISGVGISGLTWHWIPRKEPTAILHILLGNLPALERIVLTDFEERAWANMPVFPRVKEAHFYACHSRPGHVPELGRWFPSLRTLVVVDSFGDIVDRDYALEGLENTLETLAWCHLGRTMPIMRERLVKALKHFKCGSIEDFLNNYMRIKDESSLETVEVPVARDFIEKGLDPMLQWFRHSPNCFPKLRVIDISSPDLSGIHGESNGDTADLAIMEQWAISFKEVTGATLLF